MNSILKRISCFVIIFSILDLVCGFEIRINEIESNPPGKDSGNEWIELKIEKEIENAKLKLVNGDGDEITLNLSKVSGYYVIRFNKQWLDNKNEKVSLYEGNELIDESLVFDDALNDKKSWQYCNGKWEFRESTEGKENVCGEKKEEKNEESRKEENNSEKIEEEEEEEKEVKEEVKKEEENEKENLKEEENLRKENKKEEEKIEKKEVIKLESKKSEDIKSQGTVVYKSKNEIIKEKMLGIIFLVLMLGLGYILLNLRKLKSYQLEWER